MRGKVFHRAAQRGHLVGFGGAVFHAGVACGQQTDAMGDARQACGVASGGRLLYGGIGVAAGGVCTVVVVMGVFSFLGVGFGRSHSG